MPTDPNAKPTPNAASDAEAQLSAGAGGDKPAGAPTEELKPEDMAYTGRAAILREIAARAKEDRRQELIDNGHDPDQVIDVDAEALRRDNQDDGAEAGADDHATTADTDAAAAAGTGVAAPAGAPAAGSTTAKRKFKVNGKDVEFSDQEIEAIVQKHATADTRLEKATQLLEEANRRAAAVDPSGGAPRGPAPSAASGAADVRTDDAPALTRERAIELTRAIQYGNPEEATDALIEVFGMTRGAAEVAQGNMRGMNPEQIQQYVARTMTEYTAFEKARSLLDLPPEQGGYADIWSDPILQAQFRRRDDEIIDAAVAEKKPAPSYAERYATIAKELREWRDGVVQKHAKPSNPNPTLDKREQRKAAAPATVRGGDARAPAAPTDTRPKSRNEVLDGMRAARNQTRI